MNAKNFRLGNFYLENGAVKTVTPNVIEQLFESEHRQWFEPIQLNEEWLFNLGFAQFVKNNYWYRIGFGTKILNISISGNLEIENINGNCVNIGSIDYVHQLQNLYFALCGEELVFSSTEP